MKHWISATIQGRLILLISTSILGMLLVGGIGLAGTYFTFKSLESVYKSRVQPMRQLKVISESYSAKLPYATNRMNSGELTADEGILLIINARDSIKSNWESFNALARLPNEKALALRTDSCMNFANQNIETMLQTLEALKASNGGMLANQLTMFDGTLNVFLDGVTSRLDSLTTLQLDRVRDEYGMAAARFKRNILISIFLLASCFGISCFFGLLIIRQVNSQLAELLPALRAYAAGNLVHPLEQKSHDELGMIARGTHQMVESLRTLVRKLIHESSNLSSTSQTLFTASKKVYELSHNNLQQASLSEKAASGAAETMTEIAGAVAHLSGAVEIFSQSMTNVELSAQQVARQCEQENLVSTNANAQAQSARATMDELGKTADEIGSVMAVIAKIASQTNLLALNATIEAASAGESGKGFAVVAGEVKLLARQTAEATTAIHSKIEKMQVGTQSAVTSIQNIAEVIEKNQEISQAILTTVQRLHSQIQNSTEQVQSARKSSQAITQLLDANSNLIRGMSTSATEVKNASSQTDLGLQQVNDIAKSLTQVAESMNKLTEHFTLS